MNPQANGLFGARMCKERKDRFFLNAGEFRDSYSSHGGSFNDAEPFSGVQRDMGSFVRMKIKIPLVISDPFLVSRSRHAFALVIAALGILPCQSQSYVEISAEIDLIRYESRNANGAARTVTNGPLEVFCVVGTNEWRIENSFLRGGEMKWHFDGANVYQGLHATNPPSVQAVESAARLGLAVVPFEIAKSNLTIRIATTPGGHPLGNMSVNVPWLAFCSGTYLKREGRIIPLPVATHGHAPDGFAYSDKTETFDDEFGLPRKIDLYTSEALYGDSIDEHFHRLFRKKPVRRISGFPDGILKFRYAVLESTNFLGWTIPTRFEYVQNEPDEKGNWLPRYAGIGRVVSIRASSKPQSLYQPSMQQTIKDFRFRHDTKAVDAITYRSAEAHTPSTNDAELQRIFAAHVEKYPLRQSVRESRVRPMFLTFLLLAALVPLTVAFIHRKRSKQIK